MKSLRDWRPGDNIRTNDHHQQDPEAIRELQQLFRSGEFVTTGAGLEGGLAKIVDAGPDAEADYTDPRYWIQRQLFEETAYRALPTLSEDTTEASFDLSGLPGEPSIVTATNGAELAAGTHKLAVGEYVWYWNVWARGDPTRRHYMFFRSVESRNAFATATAIAGPGGYYDGKMYAGSAIDVDPAGGNPSPLDGLTLPGASDCLIVHLGEQFYSGNILRLPQDVEGKIIGITNETPARTVIVCMRGVPRPDTDAMGESLGGATSGPGNEDTWEAGGVGLNVGNTNNGVTFPVMTSRPYYNSTVHKLYFYQRIVTADALGHIINISHEETIFVDITGA